ncbi:MAG: sigma-70 family RNA polymerase sigma factor [Oscillospiraceae bacterium]|nr:sigma-70 family RNA polymerase sigma factor [Oscillospiraceae bacterium]
MIEVTLGKRFSQGDEPELVEVIDAFSEKLLRYATSILCNHHDAEDVVQRVFLQAYQNRKKFDGENISAWLYKITYNHCMNQLKKRRIFFFSDIRDVVEAVSAPHEEADSNASVLEMLCLLRAEDRALVYGRVINEQSYDELALIFGKSPAALRKQYERAKKKLAEYLVAEGKHSGRRHEHEHGFEHI